MYSTIGRRRAIAAVTGALLTASVALAAPAGASDRETGTVKPAAKAAASFSPLVVNARTGSHCTYDRLVIDVQGTSVPGVSIRPVDKLYHDGSGEPVNLPGKFFLEIRLNPAQGHTDEGQNAYQGPRLTTLPYNKLKGLAYTGDFEGYVTFGTAFATKPTWSTFTLDNPKRIVVDFPHAKTC
ncbi:AMIN-like domain-containing (lipo)protein [Streptomyces sp. BI20]|uniref:AMIN-like domain-containing (lipo)protein n=1 Tax=Streptomyces sp. BI20 TaxID=3403460 RepID=UPI003C744D55